MNVLLYVVVAKPNDPYPSPLQLFVTRAVAFRLPIVEMHTAIHLNDKPGSGAVKVGDAAFARMLPSELQAG